MNLTERYYFCLPKQNSGITILDFYGDHYYMPHEDEIHVGEHGREPCGTICNRMCSLNHPRPRVGNDSQQLQDNEDEEGDDSQSHPYSVQ